MSGHRGGRTTVVLFTRDLRMHDHTALAEAAAVSDRVVPLFVGTYVRRWVPELASVPGPRVHTPWVLDPAERDRFEYCEPLVTPARGRA